MALNRIWVYAEAVDGKVTPLTLELLAKSRTLGGTVEAVYGGADADFTSYRAGSGFLNLQLSADGPPAPSWGRSIFHVSDVDAQHAAAIAAGYAPSTAPADAPWGERYFHISDPDGHEVSFARLFGDQEG